MWPVEMSMLLLAGSSDQEDVLDRLDPLEDSFESWDCSLVIEDDIGLVLEPSTCC